MLALEWWPTVTNSNGRTYARVFIAGSCAYCGGPSVTESSPYQPAPTYCTKSHQTRARVARKTDLELQTRTIGYSDHRIAGMHEQARIIGLAIARKWRAHDYDNAKRLLNTLPEFYQEECLRRAAIALTKNPELTPRVPVEHLPTPTPLKGLNVTKHYKLNTTQTHAQQVAAHRAHRAAVSKSDHPIVEEARRRATCPRPDKVAYDDTLLGREAADWHLTELRNIDGVHANVYACPCGWLHVGGGAR